MDHHHHHHRHHHHPVTSTHPSTPITTTPLPPSSSSPHPHQGSHLQGNHLHGSDARHADAVHHHHHHHMGHPHGNAPDLTSGGDLELSMNQAEGHGSHAHAEMGHSMQPVFRWVTDVPVLFHNWTTSTPIELGLAMLTAAFLAAAYEWLRNWLSVWDGARRSLATMPRWKHLCLRVFRSLLHVLTAAVSYLQMLFAMTYDLRIFIAIILGCGLGYFVLGPYFRRLRIRQKRMRKSKRGKGVRMLSASHGGEEGMGLTTEGGEKGGGDDGEWEAEEDGFDEGGGGGGGGGEEGAGRGVLLPPSCEEEARESIL